MSEPSAAVLEAGREALVRHAWQEAHALLGEADEQGLLSADGLQMLAQASWWSGQPEAVIDVAERAYGAFLREGNPRQAAMVAFELAEQHTVRLAWPVAKAWFARAEHLVADDPDAPVHAHLAWMRAYMAASTGGDAETVAALFDEAQQIARRVGDRNAEIRSMHDKGRALCMRGELAEGSALMDEAMVAAIGGELDPLTAGIVYCGMIEACTQLGDYVRATEWTDATTRWCERNAISGFPGVCRVHRAELMRLRGAWPVAEEEARHACAELPRFNMLNGLGFAYYEIGEVRRRMGDFVGAEEAFGHAHEYGRQPEPGLSLLRLAQGKVEAAAAGVRRVLADDAMERLARVHPLEAQVEIALVADDLQTAAGAAEELASIARDVDTTAMRAIADGAGGAVRLASDDFEAAVPALRRALRGWQQIDAPYEVAEVRVLLAKAYQRLGDHEGALQELRAARDTYERLGAAWALEQTRAMLVALAGAGDTPTRIKRAFVFTDIVKSTDLVSAIGDEAWEDLLTWHDQTLRSLFAAHGGEVAHHTGDGFFVAFREAKAAVGCAVAIQQALGGHRREHGFAPLVRIGVHCADATRRGQDYSGREVHKAARIAALAAGGQVLVSKEVLEAVGGAFGASELEEVALKGIAETVKVASIALR